MANKFLPHLFVLPEDDANRQVATGFELALSSTRQVRVLTEAGGWARVGECFVSDHISPMRKFKTRFMILLVDFDEKMSRLDHVKGKIPDDLQDRVFVLGAFSTPEALRKAGLCLPSPQIKQAKSRSEGVSMGIFGLVKVEEGSRKLSGLMSAMSSCHVPR